MKKTRLLSLLMALVLLLTLPFTALAASKTMYVRKGTNLNVHSAMVLTKKNVFAVLKADTKVTQLSTSGKWSLIKLPSGQKGYVVTSYLVSKSSGSSSSSSTSGTTKYVKTKYGTGVNFRTGPSMAYSIIRVIQDGKKVTVVSTSKGWSKVTYGGKTGYIYSKYLISK